MRSSESSNNHFIITYSVQQLRNEEEPNVPWEILQSTLNIVIWAFWCCSVLWNAANVVLGDFSAIRANQEMRQWEREEAQSHYHDAPSYPFRLRGSDTASKIRHGNEAEETRNIVACKQWVLNGRKAKSHTSLDYRSNKGKVARSNSHRSQWIQFSVIAARNVVQSW